MSYVIEKDIPKSNLVKLEYPISSELKNQILKDRSEIIDIIEGNSKKKLLVIGPCSAWPNSAVIKYANQIKEISDKVSNKIKIVLRVYTQKPRTTLGWTGSINKPNPLGISDISAGIIYCRKMMIQCLQVGLPIADEALFTHSEGYFDDLLSYIVIGARSSEDQEHRIYASMINHCVGIKNPTSGNLDIAINSIITSEHSHVFALGSRQIRTFGNKYSHLILRGGNDKPNIYLEDLKIASKLVQKTNSKSIIVDVSHDNSIDPSTGKKDFRNQSKELLRVLKHLRENENLNQTIKGFMVESFIKEGNQDITNKKSLAEVDMEGLSITDKCIGIDDTIKLIKEIYEKL